MKVLWVSSVHQTVLLWNDWLGPDLWSLFYEHILCEITGFGADPWGCKVIAVRLWTLMQSYTQPS